MKMPSIFFRDLPAGWRAALCALYGLAVLAGCGGGGAEGGSVRVDGSSTVYPITEAVAEEFMRDHPGMRVTVGVSGTGGGFSKFLRGETDINDASRPIGEGELETARQNGIGFIELPIAYDGLAVVANPQNDWVECLTVGELRQMWRPGSNVDSWDDVRASFPERPLTLYGPGTSSGTYDYFTEAVVGESGASRSDFTASEDDNVLVQGIEGSPGALGFFGLAYYENNAAQLKLVAVSPDTTTGGAPDPASCVKPSLETVQSNAYRPLSRPLFMYVRQESTGDSAVASFVKYYVEEAGALAEEVGYVPLPPEEYDLVADRFRRGVTGTLFSGEGARVGLSIEELMQRTESADSAAAAGSPTARR